MSLSEGLSAVETPEGGISIIDGEGAEQAAIAAPFAYDQTYVKSSAASGYTTEAVSLSIVEDSPGLVVRLAADPAWLGDPARAFPVVIDPTVKYIGTNADTTIRKPPPPPTTAATPSWPSRAAAMRIASSTGRRCSRCPSPCWPPRSG